MHVQSGHVTQRCHNSPRWETGLHSANDFTHWKRVEDLGRFWKSQWVETRHRTSWDETCLGRRRLAFAWSRRLLWREPHVLRDGGGADENDRIERLCLSPYVEELLNSKVIKRFVPEQRSHYVFLEFRDPFPSKSLKPAFKICMCMSHPLSLSLSLSLTSTVYFSLLSLSLLF